MKLSVIIPALNANHLLTAAVTKLRGQGVFEIIIADGGSRLPPPELGEAVRIITGEPGRGLQLRAGAQAATGDWLLFLHADTTLGDGWMEAVRVHASTAPDKAAVFRFRLDDGGRAARCLEWIVARRTRWLALPYGDQGLLISRQLYEAVGGFRPIPIMEDVDMVRRIGRHRLCVLGIAAITSAERYRRDGYLHRMGRNIACLSLFFLGVSPERIRRIYA